MIHEEICTYEVAKLAKEKGFPQDPDKNDHCVMYCWDGLRNIHPLGAWIVWEMEEYSHDNLYAAPTQSLLQRWLREERGIAIEIVALPATYISGLFEYKHSVFWNSNGHYMEAEYDDRIFGTYELALEDALKYALDNLV